MKLSVLNYHKHEQTASISILLQLYVTNLCDQEWSVAYSHNTDRKM